MANIVAAKEGIDIAGGSPPRLAATVITFKYIPLHTSSNYTGRLIILVKQGD